MKEHQLEQLLKKVKNQSVSISDALETLRDLPFSDLDHSRVDHHRALRTGFPEVLLCEGKTVEEVEEIAVNLVEKEDGLLATRVQEEHRDPLLALSEEATWHPRARCVAVPSDEPSDLPGTVGVISAGTADGQPYREAVVTTELFGADTVLVPDAGVAGIHRLLKDQDQIARAHVLIVVAGMEGALPSVVGGMFDQPVIGVPSSTGYGTAFEGVTPLLGMLNSCTPSVTVVNIDNGFGAAFFACQVLKSTRGESCT